MPSKATEHVRLLTSNDLPLVRRLLYTSEYVYQRFTQEELPSLLKHYPTVGMFNGSSLKGFLLSQTVNAPSAWLGGFGLSWTESNSYLQVLNTLIDLLIAQLLKQGVRLLEYQGD